EVWSGPKQTWLKENQTRAVEFSRNNHASRTSCGTVVPFCSSVEGFVRVRTVSGASRCVVSLLYQVFRVPQLGGFRCS
ncbi:hypothetical protein, partial [Nocardiopsis alba]|uniref:hypothetical protein n=1 Tax=Nocardiopsis alba TaxID=53437 RepID=UPI0033B4E731